MTIRASVLIPSLLLAATACSQSPSLPASTNTAGTKPTPGVVTLANGQVADSLAFPSIFEAAFRQGTTAKQDAATYTFTVAHLGNLNSQTGKLLAGDPITITGRAAFAQRFPVGSFPVELALAKTTDDERVGLARVCFSEHRVAKWQLARLPGQKPLALTDSTVYCYGVDAGMGVFIDSIANQRFASRGQATWDTVFIRNSDLPGYHGYLYRFAGQNLATFTT
ncbi:MAG: DUF4241 domain-containing protein, partial [Hymenobacter sp.]